MICLSLMLLLLCLYILSWQLCFNYLNLFYHAQVLYKHNLAICYLNCNILVSQFVWLLQWLDVTCESWLVRESIVSCLWGLFCKKIGLCVAEDCCYKSCVSERWYLHIIIFWSYFDRLCIFFLYNVVKFLCDVPVKYDNRLRLLWSAVWSIEFSFCFNLWSQIWFQSHLPSSEIWKIILPWCLIFLLILLCCVW